MVVRSSAKLRSEFAHLYSADLKDWELVRRNYDSVTAVQSLHMPPVSQYPLVFQ